MAQRMLSGGHCGPRKHGASEQHGRGGGGSSDGGGGGGGGDGGGGGNDGGGNDGGDDGGGAEPGNFWQYERIPPASLGSRRKKWSAEGWCRGEVVTQELPKGQSTKESGKMVISLMQERFAQVSRPCLLEHGGEPSAELQAALPWMCRRVRQEQEWAIADGDTHDGRSIVAAGNKGAGDRIGEPKMFEGEVGR